MAGPVTFHIHLLQGHGIYCGGQVIQGQIQISSRDYMSNIRKVQITLLGFGDVDWRENVRKSWRNYDEERVIYYYETKVCRNHEEYVSNIVHQGPLSAGNHNMLFSFVLPPNLPSSFEGQHGHVRYFIEAEIDLDSNLLHLSILLRSGSFAFNKRRKQFITINSICDLNLIQGASQPQTKSNSKTFGSLFCTSGPLSATFRIPRYGYAPGEFIPISVEVENLSKKLMNCTKARLYQDVKFKAPNGTKTRTRILQELTRGPIEAGDSFSYEDEPLSIPPVPPSGLSGCRIIDVPYRLEFLVYRSGISIDLKVSIPITIGTIPLRIYFQQLASASPNYPQSNTMTGPLVQPRSQ